MILKNISVDCVIFGFVNDKLMVLLWQAEPELLEKFLTTHEEYQQIKELFEKNPALGTTEDYWGLIGSHLPDEEDLDKYANKLLKVTTGLDNVYRCVEIGFADFKVNDIASLRLKRLCLDENFECRLRSETGHAVGYLHDATLMRLCSVTPAMFGQN